MAEPIVLTFANNRIQLSAAVQSTAGVGDAGKLLALSATGLIDPSVARGVAVLLGEPSTFTAAPPSITSGALVNMTTTPIVGGNSAGTFWGYNQASASGADVANVQVGGSMRYRMGANGISRWQNGVGAGITIDAATGWNATMIFNDPTGVGCSASFIVGWPNYNILGITRDGSTSIMQLDTLNRRVGIGGSQSTQPRDTLTVLDNPIADATRGALNLGNQAIVGGSTVGTWIIINQSGLYDWFNFQQSGVSALRAAGGTLYSTSVNGTNTIAINGGSSTTFTNGAGGNWVFQNNAAAISARIGNQGVDTYFNTGARFGFNTVSPLDYFSLGVTPVAGATRAAVNLGNIALSGASSSGTWIGINQATSSADPMRYQVAGVDMARIEAGGAICSGTASSYTGLSGSTMRFVKTSASVNVIVFSGWPNNGLIGWSGDGGSTSFFTMDTVNKMVMIGGTVSQPRDVLSVAGTPAADATRCLVNLGNVALVGGSTSGTWWGINQSGNADWFNFQKSGVSYWRASGYSIYSTTASGTNIFTLNSSGETVLQNGSSKGWRFKSSGATTLAKIGPEGDSTFFASGGTFGLNTTGPISLFSLGGVPIADATDAMINLGNSPLVGGSINGAWIGGNEPSDADWINLQQGGVSALRVYSDGSTQIAATAWVYIGDAATDSSWRIGRNGSDMVAQRRESGAWVDKQRVLA